MRTRNAVHGQIQNVSSNFANSLLALLLGRLPFIQAILEGGTQDRFLVTLPSSLLPMPFKARIILIKLVF